MSNGPQEAPRSPGVTFEVRRPSPDPSPLRTDVAGIIARTERGPMSLDSAGRAVPIRVVGQRGFEALFGEAGSDPTGCAIRGYFENGGELLWVVRAASAARTANAVLDVRRACGTIGSIPPGSEVMHPAATLKIVAAREGPWARELEFRLTLHLDAASPFESTADVALVPKKGEEERWTGLAARRLVEQVNAKSKLVRIGIGEPTTLGVPAESVIEFPAAKLDNASFAASAELDVSRASGCIGPFLDNPADPMHPFCAKTLEITASSEGSWGNELEFLLTLRKGATPAGKAMADVLILRKGQMVEHLLGLDPETLVDQVTSRSALVRIEIGERSTGALTERLVSFPAVKLANGAAAPPSALDYQRAGQALLQEPEPAILMAPGVWDDLKAEDDALSFYLDWTAGAAALLDRLVLVDPPPDSNAQALLALGADLRRLAADRSPSCLRAAALYGPWLEVPSADPTSDSPTRPCPPSGHLAGIISRFDRERGAHHTPANVALTGAVDLALALDNAERAVLTQRGLNTLRCSRSRGVEVWGGRTLDLDTSRRFLAHRRLIHRLVRAMRQTAEPLVFDSNTPTLRLMFVRALTSVLLEAFRAGALKGARAEEAFRVACDDRTNPPDAYETGFCVSEVELAPAAPMEFIHLVVTLSQDGTLQVLE